MRNIIAGLALAACSAAHADIVYQWQTLDARGATSTLLGELRLVDAVYGGAADVVFQPTTCTTMPFTCGPGEERGNRASPVIQLALWVDGWVSGLNANIHEGTGFPDGTQQRLSVLVSGLGHGIDGGSITSSGSSADVAMTGAGGIWSIDFLSSDNSRLNFKHCWADFCPLDNGPITGQWVLATQMPLPSTLPLVMLGLAGVGATWRRRSGMQDRHLA